MDASNSHIPKQYSIGDKISHWSPECSCPKDSTPVRNSCELCTGSKVPDSTADDRQDDETEKKEEKSIFNHQEDEDALIDDKKEENINHDKEV